MQIPHSSSPLVSGRTSDMLPSTWVFRLASLAFIADATPFLAVNMHGLVGFLLILGLAIFVGLSENIFNLVLRSMFEGISQNKLLFLFAILYLVDFVINLLFSERWLDNWRLMVSPVVMLIAICYVFAFMHNDLCYRYFQIGFIIVSGLQAVLSIQVLAKTTDIARMMWAETSGAWIYGNQIVFVTYVMIVPVLFWRSFRESGRVLWPMVISSPG